TRATSGYSFSGADRAFIVGADSGRIGDVNTTDDDVFTHLDLQNAMTSWWIMKSFHSLATSQANGLGDKLSESWTFYDQSSVPGGIGAAGDVTRSEAWSGNAGDTLGAAQNRASTYGYDVYGNQTSTVDGENHLVHRFFGESDPTKTFVDRVHVDTGGGT